MDMHKASPYTSQKKMFKKNSIFTGILVALGSEVAVIVLLYIGLIIAGVSPADHLRWFGGCFIPPVLFLRYYAKQKDYPLVTKTIIITLFITFITFMFFVKL